MGGGPRGKLERHKYQAGPCARNIALAVSCYVRSRWPPVQAGDNKMLVPNDLYSYISYGYLVESMEILRANDKWAEDKTTMHPNGKPILSYVQIVDGLH